MFQNVKYYKREFFLSQLKVKNFWHIFFSYLSNNSQILEYDDFENVLLLSQLVSLGRGYSGC